MIRIQAARVRQDPQRGIRYRLVLTAKRRAQAIERDAVRPKADDCDDARSISTDLTLEASSARAKLPVIELGSRRGGSGHQVRRAAFGLEQLGLLPGVQPPGREARVVEGWPETVAWSREMVAGRGRVEAGIDPAE
jgi:hypothetical protein